MTRISPGAEGDRSEAALPEFAVIVIAVIPVTGVKAQGRTGQGGRRPQAPGNQGRIRSRGQQEPVSASDAAPGARTDPADTVMQTRKSILNISRNISRNGDVCCQREPSQFGGGRQGQVGVTSKE